MPYTAILNSHQTKTPLGNDPWVRQTLDAVAYAATLDATILSSIGLNIWELVTWAAGQKRARLALVVPPGYSESDGDEIIRRFALRSADVGWIVVEGIARSQSEKSWWEARDRAVLQRADLIFPVSVSNSGHLASLLQEPHGTQTIDDQFRIPFAPKPHHALPHLADLPLNPEIASLTGRFLIHWTRTCHGPWPGETEAEFYSDLVESRDEYCRSAKLTLERIVAEKRIRGSAWRIGANRPMVAFTELSPVESVRLMRWRSRWSRWSFEPYGIMIDRSIADEVGIRPVHYVTESDWRRLSDEEKPYCHRIGKKADLWPAEKEWRCAGDVDISQLDPNSVRVIVRTQAEAETWNRTSHYEAIALFEF